MSNNSESRNGLLSARSARFTAAEARDWLHEDVDTDSEDSEASDDTEVCDLNTSIINNLNNTSSVSQPAARGALPQSGSSRIATKRRRIQTEPTQSTWREVI
uniref:Uncharacterized protein n=1 Tax=Arion vulgaris TaxID=1028688 RepID=A0A0B7BFH0_9EUPU